jgi:hypothetical protein
MCTKTFNSKIIMMMCNFTMKMQMKMNKKMILFCALYVT